MCTSKAVTGEFRCFHEPGTWDQTDRQPWNDDKTPSQIQTCNNIFATSASRFVKKIITTGPLNTQRDPRAGPVDSD